MYGLYSSYRNWNFKFNNLLLRAKKYVLELTLNEMFWAIFSHLGKMDNNKAFILELSSIRMSSRSKIHVKIASVRDKNGSILFAVLIYKSG